MKREPECLRRGQCDGDPVRHHRLVRRVAGGMVVADAARDRVGIRVRNVHPGVAEPHPFPPPNGRVDVVHHVVRDVCAGQRPVPGTSGTADALDAPPRVFHGTPDPVGRGSAPRDPRSADEEHPRRGHRLPKPGRGPSPIGKRSGHCRSDSRGSADAGRLRVRRALLRPGIDPGVTPSLLPSKIEAEDRLTTSTTSGIDFRSGPSRSRAPSRQRLLVRLRSRGRLAAVTFLQPAPWSGDVRLHAACSPRAHVVGTMRCAGVVGAP